MHADKTKDPALFKQYWEQTKSKTCAGAFDIELVDISEHEIVLRMEITDASRQPMGLFHGGVSMVLAESAGSMHACWGTDLTKVNPVGIEINGSHVGSAGEGHVVATARVLKRGRTLVVHEVEIVHEESGRLLNLSRITNLYVPVKG